MNLRQHLRLINSVAMLGAALALQSPQHVLTVYAKTSQNYIPAPWSDYSTREMQDLKEAQKAINVHLTNTDSNVEDLKIQMTNLEGNGKGFLVALSVLNLLGWLKAGKPKAT